MIEDFDSQDSNREDHEQNEYPDDMDHSDEDEIGGAYNESEDEDEEVGYQDKMNELEDEFGDNIMSDEAPQRNGNRKKLKNSIFDKLFKKNKDWSY